LTSDLGWRLALSVVVMLIALIGGRIIPSFTGNWLGKRDEPRPPAFGRFDRLTLIVTGVALVLWSAAASQPLVASVLALAAIANAVRLARWRGHRTLSEPLLWILHFGYAWMPIGLALLATSQLTPQVPQSAAVHALTAGLMAVMIVAVSSRATLGHTGRLLHAGIGTTAIYLLILGAAITRVVSSLWPVYSMELLAFSGGLWIAGFALYLLLYGPMLTLPDPRQRTESPRQQDAMTRPASQTKGRR
jgi:uncharacterized protein involved in response to NO